MAAEGQPSTVIAARVDACVDVVSKWPGRFAVGGLAGLAGLAGRKRTGRPRSFLVCV